MSKLLLLYSTILVSLVFLLVPANDVTMGFLFSDMMVTVEYYIFSIFEKFVLIILAYIIANESTEYRNAVWIFFWLMVADLVDYLLTYSDIWFSIDELPVSMNILKSLIFGVAILHAYIWEKRDIL